MKLSRAIGMVRIAEEQVLSYLQKSKLPVPRAELMENLGLTSLQLTRILNSLREQGYDIKGVIRGGEEYYSLVRYGKLTTEHYYKELGEIRTPILLTGDWHIGAKSHSDIAYREMIKDIDEFDIRHVLVAGDVIQGLGVHALEREDLSLYSIDEQVDEAIEKLKEIPSRVKVHLIMGNHEQKIRAEHKIGFDACAAIAKALRNVTYYGYTATLTLNKDHSIFMLHGKGGGSYASSYVLEKVFRNLTERPSVLCLGHFHELTVVHKPPNYLLVKPGCLQRETIYIMSMGVAAQVGWIILEDYNDERATPLLRCPRVY